MAIDPTNEQAAVDYMTHAMLSASLLLELSAKVYSEEGNRVTIRQFYDGFNQTHASNRFRPFNEGVILGLLNWIMFAKENWYDLVLNDDFSTWGINPSRFDVPNPNPKDSGNTRTLQYFVRRLRNALGHGNVSVKVPLGAKLATMMTDITISFHDVSKADTFDVELTLEEAYNVARNLHKIIHTDVAQRHGVTPPAPQTKP
jgi:hypothetical protein